MPANTPKIVIINKDIKLVCKFTPIIFIYINKRRAPINWTINDAHKLDNIAVDFFIGDIATLLPLLEALAKLLLIALMAIKPPYKHVIASSE